MKNKVLYVMAAIGILSIVLIIVPILAGALVSIDGPAWLETENEWIGFWGGYIGTIVGSLVTLFVLSGTLKDNKNARERAEKVEYYNRLIEVHSSFTVDTANYFAYITRMIVEKGNDLYRESVLAGNQSAKMSIELTIRLSIRKGEGKVDSIIKWVEDISDEINNATDLFHDLAKENFLNVENNNKLIKKLDDIMDKMNQYTLIFTEVVKAELGNI